jgi:hypothetical protein
MTNPTAASPTAASPAAGSRVRRALLLPALLLVIALVAAVATVAVRSTMALLGARTTSSTAQLAAGTVGLGQSASSACAASTLLPGSGVSTCTLSVTYAGTESAYLGLDVLIQTQAGVGGTRLYNPGDSANGLQVAVTSTAPSVTYTVPVSATSCPSGAPTGSTCYALDKQLVSVTAVTSGSAATTFTTAVSLPSTSTGGYRGGAAQVILTAHAVQAAGNSVAGCTTGVTCSLAAWN